MTATLATAAARLGGRRMQVYDLAHERALYDITPEFLAASGQGRG